MKSRLIDAAAFVIGAIAAFIQGGAAADFPWPIQLALSLLTPGYIAGLPLTLLAGALGLGSLSFFFLVGILVNGLIFGLASYFIRNATKGQRVARLALAIGMGAWITWGAVYAIRAWPRPDHLAPVDLSSPLAGRWNGVLHAQRGDRSIVLVCHPHTDQALDGYLYITGMDMGRFEEGVWAADSLHFDIGGFRYSAHFDSTTMAMARSAKGMSQSMALRFVGADTTRPAIHPGAVHFP